MSPSYTVVLIEDDPDLRALTRATLQFTAGWEVMTAASGPEGLEVVRRVRPDAVIVDLMMPGMDGYDVCQNLTGDPETAGTPVVFLTARKRVDEARMRAVGAAGVIFKPFEPEQLATQIQRLCEGSGIE